MKLVYNTYLVLILCLQQGLFYNLHFDYRLLVVLYSKQNIYLLISGALLDTLHTKCLRKSSRK